MYQVLAKGHTSKYAPDRPSIILFYDESKKECIKYAKNYDKKHGYTITNSNGAKETIADILIQEKSADGKILNSTPLIKFMEGDFKSYGKHKVHTSRGDLNA